MRSAAARSGDEGEEPLRRAGDQLRKRPTPRSEPRQRRAPVVLIVDDTLDTRELYASYFVSRGFRVLTAEDGESAVRTAFEQRPSVIVMDLSMPRLDGIAATQRIKRDARTRQTRVIILTGYPYKAIERGALESGADKFLTKPCLPEDLERSVRELLSVPPRP